MTDLLTNEQLGEAFAALRAEFPDLVNPDGTMVVLDVEDPIAPIEVHDGRRRNADLRALRDKVDESLRRIEAHKARMEEYRGRLFEILERSEAGRRMGASLAEMRARPLFVEVDE